MKVEKSQVPFHVGRYSLQILANLEFFFDKYFSKKKRFFQISFLHITTTQTNYANHSYFQIEFSNN